MTTENLRESLGRIAHFASKAPGVNDLGRSLIQGECAEIAAALDELDRLRAERATLIAAMGPSGRPPMPLDAPKER